MSDSALDHLRLLRKLLKGLHKREAMPGGAAREGLDAHLIETIGNLADTIREPDPPPIDTPPPRSIAVALALALFSQPHLATTCGRPTTSQTEPTDQPPPRPPDPPVVPAVELMAEALGLDQWQLDELREDVDRRVGIHLLRIRCVHWLWSHFNLPSSTPDTLFRVLFPGAPNRIGDVGLVRRGARIYAIVDQRQPPPPAALHLSWLPVPVEDAFAPLGTFHARYIDVGLRSTLGRSIGIDEHAVSTLLDEIVTIVPRKRAGAYVAHDHWRVGAFEAATQLEGRRAETDLSRSLLPDEVSTAGWLTPEGGELVVRSARVAFDALALGRVTRMVRQLYASMLAALLDEEYVDDPATWQPWQADDLVLYDLQRHLEHVLKPLLDWAGSAHTAAMLARQHGLAQSKVQAALGEVSEIWREHAASAWWALPSRDNATSVLTRLAVHLCRTHDSLRRLFHREPEGLTAHQDVLVLFAGHYFAEAPLDRLWLSGDDVAFTADPIGRWFWPAWTRLREAMENDTPSAFTMEVTR